MHYFSRLFIFASIALISLISHTSLAQPFQSGNILVSSDNRLIEITPSGFVVQDIPIPPTADSYPQSRDLIVNADGNVAIFNGTGYPELSVYDPVLDSWAPPSQYFNWSTVNNLSYGGIAAYGDSVYVTDMSTGIDTPTDNNGIIQFFPDGTAVRHLAGQDYIDLTLGLDGLFYALRDLYGRLDVIDPGTMTVITSHALGHTDDIRGVAVNPYGEIYAVTWGGLLNKYDPTGILLDSIPTGANSISDIDINASGKIIFQDRIGNAYFTNESFDPPQPIPLPVPSYSASFVAFVDNDALGGSNAYNIIVSSDNTLFEYNKDGQLLQQIPMPVNPETTGKSRDLIATPKGNIAVFNGTFDPELQLLNTSFGGWIVNKTSNWSTINNISFGGIAADANGIYVTDMVTGSDTPETGSGIVRFMEDGSYPPRRYLPGNEYIDLTIGLDNVLYGLSDFSNTIDVINPAGMFVANTIQLQSSEDIRGIAVNEAGEIYAVTWEGNVYHFDSSGMMLNALYGAAFNPYDIDINILGDIVFQDRNNDVYITDAALSPPTIIQLPVPYSASSFVAFVKTGILDNALPDDTDYDGIPDNWEIANNLDPYYPFDAEEDYDFDGLSNLDEYLAGTDPNLADTDADQLLDGDELVIGTDPANSDSDGDGMDDGWEWNTWFDPLDPADANGDFDLDGLTNLQEYLAGTIPDNPDTDADGVLDGDEVNAGLNPLNPDSDGDSMTDGWEQYVGLDPLNANDGTLDSDNDGLINAKEFSNNTEPFLPDTDADGLTDGDEIYVYGSIPTNHDSDNDSINDGEEVLQYGTNPNTPDSDSDGLSDADELFVHSTNPLSNDSDGDTMTDGWEINYRLNPLDPADAINDLDLDGFSNVEEFQAETRPDDASHFPGGPSTLKWSFATGGPITSAPALGTDGSIYFSSRDHHVYALNPDGSLKWSVNIGGWGSSTTLGADGTIYVGTYSRKLYAIAPDGSIKWSFDTVGSVYATPVLGVDGTIYVGSYKPSTFGTDPAYFYAIYPNGTLKWSKPVPADIRYAAAISKDGSIYVGTNEGVLLAYDKNGNTKLSAYVSPGMWLRPPAIDSHGDVYVQSTNNALYRVSPIGLITKVTSLGPVVLSSPVIGNDGTIYTGGYNTELIAINPDGSIKWATPVSSTFARVNTTPAIGADGTIYVGAQDGKLHAVNPDGTLMWDYQAGNRISSNPSISNDGTVYVGSEDGSLYAINSSSNGLAKSPWPAFSRDNYRTGNVLTTSPKITSAVVNNVSNTGWMNVVLPKHYYSMVIATTPVYDKTLPPLVTRIQRETGNSFDIRVDRADGQSGPVTGVSIHYIVVEEGSYNAVEHGITMEAHKFVSTLTDRAGSWNAESQTLTNSYTNPVVLGQVMSYNDPRFSVFWSRGNRSKNPATMTDFRVGKHIAEDPDKNRLDETIGYIVMESGSGQVNEYSYLAARGSDTIRGVQNGTYQYNFSFSGFNSPTSVIATQTAMDGGNGGWAILTGTTPLTASSISLAIDEDQIKDNERSHTSEQVDYIVFEKLF
jgi:outer membrane protein assembly factor BamB